MTLDDAPILTRRQIEAIEYIDETSDHGEYWADVSQFHRTILNNLEERGFVTLREEEGELWAMPTDDGLEAAIWHIANTSREEYIERGYRIKSEQKKMAKKLSSWELQARENLSDKQIEAMLLVKQSDNWLDANEVNHHTRKSLERYGYLEYNADNNTVRLTADGYSILEESNVEEVQNHEAAVRQNINGVTSKIRPFGAEVDNEDSPVETLTPVDETPLTPTLRKSQKVDGNCTDCNECVYREVVDLISKKHPEVGELADALVAQKKILARLKLGE